TPPSARLLPVVLLVTLIVAAQAVALLVSSILIILDPAYHQLQGTAKYFLVFLFILGSVWIFVASFSVYRGHSWPCRALVCFSQYCMCSVTLFRSIWCLPRKSLATLSVGRSRAASGNCFVHIYG